ncbi:MAG TPA: hypothetical protein VFY49_16940 [Myxococcota bacterium]|nr:hypothetical protein [Myxococcota bacterium]
MKLRLALAATLSAVPVQAAVTLDAQTREISFDSLRTRTELFCTSPQSCSVLSQTNTPDSGSQSAPDFAPFDASLSSSIFPSVAVSQESTLTTGRMKAHASGAAAGAASLGTSGGFPPTFIETVDSHQTRSLYHVEFTLDEPTGYALDGSIAGGEAGFIGDLDLHIELRHAGGAVVHRIELADSDDCLDPSCATLGPLSLDEQGTLAPGSYVLDAELVGQTGALVTFQVQAANAHLATFDVDLQLGTAVPIPAFVTPLAGLALAAAARRRLSLVR